MAQLLHYPTTPVQASHEGKLSLHQSLNLKALIFSKLNKGSWLSIEQLCDEEYITLFDIKWLFVLKNNAIALTGKRKR